MSKRLLLCFIIINAGIFIFFSYKISIWYIDSKKTDENIIKLQNTVIIKEDNEDKIDFNKLLEVNDEVMGWIKVDNTNINYPFVKHNDNKYYLNHSIDKTYNTSGWVFADYRIDSVNSNHVILYGHDKKDKSMFGTLRDLFNKDIINNNKIITVNTKDDEYHYEIFSMYHIKNSDDYLNININGEFIKLIKDRSMYSFGVSVNSSDKILTLSTCYGSESKSVIHAKLIK